MYQVVDEMNEITYSCHDTMIGAEASRMQFERTYPNELFLIFDVKSMEYVGAREIRH